MEHGILKSGTYVRESDGATLLYHSETTWNDPVFAVNSMRFDRAGSHMYWRLVNGAEAEAVHRAYALRPGEYMEHEL